MPDTDSRSWSMPTVGGSAGTWGTELNAMVDDEIEADVDAIEATANAALPKAGGVMTGEVEIATERYDTEDHSNISGSTSLDLDVANFHFGTITGSTTFSFTNWPSSGKAEWVTLELTNGGSEDITWPAAVMWDGGSEPTLQSSGVDVLSFYSRDGGSTIRGMHAYSAN